MPDVNAIAAAVAARYAPGTMTAPSGLADVRGSGNALPQSADVLPRVLVFPDSGEMEYGTSMRQSVMKFRVQFLYSQGLDIPRDSVAVARWVTVLVDQLKAAAQLGGTVDSARVSAWRVVKASYGGEDFYAVELDVTVVKTEPWTATA